MPPKPASEYALLARDLTKRFGRTVAVDHLNLGVRPGEIFGFLGPNGAGKSTTIRMLCGIMMPTSGYAEVLGIDVRRQPERVKQRIGYVAQRLSLYDDLTVRENLSFYAGVYSLTGEARRKALAEQLEMAGLVGRENDLAGTLSGGLRQRLALASAVLHSPEVLFLDEPTVGLDPLSRRRFWDIVYHLAGRGIAVFISTHYMDEAERCHTLGFLYGGKMIAYGTPSDLRTRAMRGVLWEVKGGSTSELLAALRDLPGARSAYVFRDAVRIHADDSLRADDVARAARARGFGSASVERAEPSLEEVFVSLVGPEAPGGGAPPRPE